MELLVRIVDKGPDIDHEKAGMVIDIRPDGHPWSELEKTHPEAHIISAPIIQSYADLLKQPHSFGMRVRGKKYPHRTHHLDLTKLPSPDEFKAGGRTKPMVNMATQDILGAIYEVK